MGLRGLNCSEHCVADGLGQHVLGTDLEDAGAARLLSSEHRGEIEVMGEDDIAAGGAYIPRSWSPERTARLQWTSESLRCNGP